MTLKHVDIIGNNVFQDAREVKTKFSKMFTVFFFPVGDGTQQSVVNELIKLNNLIFSCSSNKMGTGALLPLVLKLGLRLSF